MYRVEDSFFSSSLCNGRDKKGRLFGVVWCLAAKAISPSQIVEAVTNGTVSVILNSETSQWRSLTYMVRKIEKTGIIPNAEAFTLDYQIGIDY